MGGEEERESDEQARADELKEGLERTLAHVGQSQNLQEGGIDSSQWPEWFCNLAQEIGKMFLGPEVRELRDGKHAYGLGKETGYSLSLVKQLQEGFPGVESIRDRDGEVCEGGSQIFDQLKQMLQGPEQQCREMLPCIWRHPYALVVEFYRGFSKGLSQPTVDNDGKPTRGTLLVNVYAVLMLSWEKVEELRVQRGGGPKLHGWVMDHLEKGFQMEFETFRKLCGRLGLRFGPVGRPPKK